MEQHSITVDRDLDPQAMLDATGRTQYVDKHVVNTMPRGEGKKATVYLFTVGIFLTDTALEQEYEKRGLAPASPYDLAAFNDDRNIATHWKDAKGYWCYAAFDRWIGLRNVSVGRHGFDWGDNWWFGGRKSLDTGKVGTSQNLESLDIPTLRPSRALVAWSRRVTKQAERVAAESKKLEQLIERKP